MTEPAMRYAALVERPDDFKPAAVADALAAWKGVPAHDVMAAARRCWGIVAEDEEKERAEALVGRLTAAKVAALSVPRNLLEELPPLSRIGTLDRAVASRVVLVAAMGFKKTVVKEIKTVEGPSAAKRAVKIGLMAAGIPMPIGGSQEVVRKVEETDLVFYADLVLTAPAARLRVDAQDFDYSFLGARKAYAVAVNFRTLLEDLCDLAPKAARNRGCRYIVEGKPLRETGYEGLEDLEREERWLLTLKSLGKLA